MSQRPTVYTPFQRRLPIRTSDAVSARKKELMQDWADLLDDFKKQKVVRRAA